MILKIFSVYDSKSEAYIPPFYALTAGQAIRSFTDTVNEANHAFNKHPADFTLFLIGEFDDAHGAVMPYAALINLGLASEYINQEI